MAEQDGLLWDRELVADVVADHYASVPARTDIDAEVPLWRQWQGPEEGDITVILYVLFDPRTAEIRYVGQTTQSLEQRLRGHMQEALSAIGQAPNRDRDKVMWICSLIAQEMRPVIKRVGWAVGESADLAEKHLIAQLWLRGARLVNYVGTPQSWCSGTNDKTCPLQGGHALTIRLRHGLYINLLLETAGFDLGGALEETITEFVHENYKRRFPDLYEDTSISPPALSDGDDTCNYAGAPLSLEDIPF